MDPQWKGISDKYIQDDCSFSNLNKIRAKVGGGDLNFQVAEVEDWGGWAAAPLPAT